jgi:cytochrome c556
MNRIRLLLCAWVVLLMPMMVVAAGCQTANTQHPQPDYTTTATIKDIMKSIVDPSADVVWNSVQSVADERGLVDIAPRTDEEWQNTRMGAIRLVEATNLLLIPGRHVGAPGEKSEAEDELEPAQMEELINKDRQAWYKRVSALHDAAEKTLRAIDKKDANEVFVLGDQIEHACESCHTQYWYPNQKLPPGYEEPAHPGEHAKPLQSGKS